MPYKYRRLDRWTDKKKSELMCPQTIPPVNAEPDVEDWKLLLYSEALYNGLLL